MKTIWTLMFTLSCACAFAAKDPAPAVCDAASRLSTELTVYESSLALVRETRQLALSEGEGRVHLTDIPAQIVADSVLWRTLPESGDFSLLEQSFRYDMDNEGQLLGKYIGKKIKLVDFDQNKVLRETPAVVLSAGNAPMFLVEDQIFTGQTPAKLLPLSPGEVFTRPTLCWTYLNKGERKRTVELLYLTQGVGWEADYTLRFDAQSSRARLSGWAAIHNNTQTAFVDAKIRLVAGSLNITESDNPREMSLRAAPMMLAAAPAPAAPKRSALGDYHQYELPRPVSLGPEQTKQVGLIDTAPFAVEREYSTASYQAFHTNSGKGQNAPVKSRIVFMNTTENKLGLPLPSGTVRVYTADEKSGTQFLGEDRLEASAAGDRIEIDVGTAFDLKVRRTQTDHRVLGDNFAENGWEILLRNSRNGEAEINIDETFGGAWEILSNSAPFSKADSQTARFKIKLSPGQETTLKYRVRIKDRD